MARNYLGSYCSDGVIKIGAYQLPNKKLPTLCVEERNEATVCGRFYSAELADLFMDKLVELCRAKNCDMVAVIRCRDCKYWQDNNGGYPHEECRWGKEETPDEDDYCSYGERRE